MSVLGEALESFKRKEGRMKKKILEIRKLVRDVLFNGITIGIVGHSTVLVIRLPFYFIPKKG